MSRAWTPQERSRAIQWRNHGRPPAFIAQRLGRSVMEVDALLETTKRGAEKPKKIERKCLCCLRPFMSDGNHNRMCDRCRKDSQGVPPGMVEMGDGCRVAGAGRRG